MKIYIIYPLIGLLLNINVQASHDQFNQTIVTKNYIGFRLGQTKNHTSYSRKVSPSDNITSPSDSSFSNKNFIYILCAGRRYFIGESFFIGGEFDLSFGRIAYNKTVSFSPNGLLLKVSPQPSISGKTTISSQYSFSPSLTLGVKWSKKLLSFVGIGFTSKKFKIESTQKYKNDISTFKTRKRKSALKLSLGAEYLLSDHLSLRLNVSHEKFSKISSFAHFSNTKLVDFVSAKPSFTTITLGMNYKF